MGYQQFFQELARPGRQGRRLGEAWVFVLPSTSARNAAYPRQVILASFQELQRLRDELQGVRDPSHGPATDLGASRTLLP
jgi:hypothetical protein